ncbi:MAG: S1 family peptidase [Pirellulaceae bacterium]
MADTIRCPRCDLHFSRSQLANATPGQCPACDAPLGNPDPASDSVLASSSSIRKPSISASAPRRLQTSAQPADRKRTNSDISGGTAVADDGKKAQPEFAIAAGEGTSSAYPFRKKKRIWTTLLAWGLAIASIGGLFTIVSVMSDGRTEPSAQSPPDDGTEDADDVSEEVVDEIDQALAERDMQPVRTARSQPAPVRLDPVDETPIFFTEREHEQLWKKINSYLVRLEVRTPVEKRTVTGMIVDSRGWVLTSLSALQDAGEVSVAVAAKELGGETPVREMVDLSRGIIASDPKFDLALISINRAQVINIADIAMAERDDIVPARRLLVARTPPIRHRSWLTECRVSQRGNVDRLDELLQTSIRNAGLTDEGAVEWLAFPPTPETNRSQEMAGSPLLESDGTVVAISTGVFADDELVVVPVAHVRNLIASISGSTPQPSAFPRAADLARQLVAEADVEASPEAAEKADTQNSWTGIITGLVSTTSQCRETDWTAESTEEYASLQKLAEHLYLAHRWIGTNLELVDNPEYFDEQLQAALEEIGLSLEDDLIIDEFEAGKGNEYFSEQVNSGNPWFALYAVVEKDLFNSPRFRGQNTVVFRILGTDEYVLSPIYEDARSFRSGRRFLLFGKLDPRGSIKTDQFGDQDRLELIDVFTFFELMRR